MHWKKVTLIGVGLLGGSIGLALKKRRLAGSVVGYVRRNASISESHSMGAVDEATRDLPAAVSGADLVILCTPMGQMQPLLEQMSPALKDGAIVTDVGSVKRSVLAELESQMADTQTHFVGSHPMAGSEKTGISAARADLFEQAVCVVTPTPGTDARALKEVKAFWKALGCRVLSLTPSQHDLLVSRSSHLPHLLAAQLVRFVLDPKLPREQALLCANGFRDCTRVASGSPEMWRDIMLGNADYLVYILERFALRLSEFSRALKRHDGETILQFFEEAKSRRDAWVKGQRSKSSE